MQRRDLAQLEPNARSAIEAARILWQQYHHRSTVYATLGDAVDEWSKCEPGGSFELRSLRVLSQAINFSSPHIGGLAETIKVNIYEPILFLEGSCLDSARQCCDKLNKLLPRSALNSYSHSSGVGMSGSRKIVGPSEGDTNGGRTDGDSWGRDSSVGHAGNTIGDKERESTGAVGTTHHNSNTHSHGVSLYAEDLEILQNVIAGTKCWDSTRRIRAGIITSNVIQCVNKLIAEVCTFL